MSRGLFWGVVAIPLCIAILLAAFFLTPTSDDEAGEVTPSAKQQAHASFDYMHPSVLSGHKLRDGSEVRLECGTCHDLRTPNRNNRCGEKLTDFHKDLQTSHGKLTCLSCHNAEDYNTLKLADGKSLPFEKQIELCAQCHGPQYRDYSRGSHGGMRGYWKMDAEGAYRERNLCTDCHDVHAPQIQKVLPLLPPRDRFLSKPGAEREE